MYDRAKIPPAASKKQFASTRSTPSINRTVPANMRGGIRLD